jgi:hypothetical protein
MIALQEEFDLSAKAFARSVIRNDTFLKITKERDQQSSKKLKQEKQAIKSNSVVMRRLREVNHYDIRLYNLGKDNFFPFKQLLYHVGFLAVSRFCEMMKGFPDLYISILSNNKVKCQQ